MAANVPSTELRGTYVEARTADVYTGPCFANSETELTGDLAVMGWKIDQGSFNGVKLDGLSVVGVLKASNTLGNYMRPVYPVKSVLIVDENASIEQRMALKAFAQKMAGDLLTDIVRTEVRPITLKTADIHSRSVSLTAGELAKVATRALENGDQVCHNESVYYPPLVKLEHAMAAYTVDNSFQGTGLGTNWSYPGKRGSFVGTFQVSE
jgi:hypothetical protein